MNVFPLHRTIGVLFLSSLFVVSGCGDYKRAAKKTCKVLKDCEPRQFDLQYRSMNHCVQEFQHYLELIEEFGTKDCAKAAADYQICAAKDANETCVWGGEDGYGYPTFAPGCAKEFSASEDLCADVDWSEIDGYDYYYDDDYY